MQNLSFKFVGALALAAFLGGCGGDDSVNIEPPLLSIRDNYIYIQSKDNNTIIKDIIVNKGNCGVFKYLYRFDKSKFDASYAPTTYVFYSLEERKNIHGDRAYIVLFKGSDGRIVKYKYQMDRNNFYKAIEKGLDLSNKEKVIELLTKDEFYKKVMGQYASEIIKEEYDEKLRGFIRVYAIYNDDDLKEFNALDDKAKSYYVKEEAEFNKIISFGEKKRFSMLCSQNSILEIELVTNGGTFTYEFNQC